MKTVNRQYGASLLLWLIILGLGGTALVVGMRLVPIYIESYMVDEVLEETALESRGRDRNKNQIWSSIYRRFTINNINNIKKEHFSYTKEKGKTIIALTYEVRTPLIANIDGIVSFERSRIIESDE
jgi:hypothetical protein